MALHLQITALMSVLEEVQLASRVHRELGMYAKRPEDGKEDVLISAVLVFVLEEICGACHLCPLEILQARLRARDIRSCPDVLRFTCRVEATDHGGQSGVRSQVLRLETCPQLHHLELCGIETSQLLFIVAAGLQRIHVGKHWYVRNRVQHVGEGHIMPTHSIESFACIFCHGRKIEDPATDQDSSDVKYTEKRIEALQRQAKATFGLRWQQTREVQSALAELIG
mmetsp:Transcript_36065/g.84364  ORF Transcript_36065/g.84364 Transcript_36065/m.84364 type:complete len:225 (-) Transcript_36065:1105-1779(-)